MTRRAEQPGTARDDTGSSLRRAALTLVPSLAVGAAARAQEPFNPAVDVVPKPTITEPEVYSPDFSGAAGVDVVTAYISRGIVFSSKASVQPWFEGYLSLPWGDDAGLVRDSSLYFGTWNSLQSGGPGLGQTRDDGALDNWYELDLYGGVALSLPRNFATSFAYFYYTSPSDSFNDIHEVEWKLRYDDAWYWRERYGWDVALNPALRVAKEVSQEDSPLNLYVQPSITATIPLDDWPLRPTLEVPLVLGFGDNGQYRDADGDDIFFGFAQSGASLAFPLVERPDGEELWLDAGVKVIIVSDEDINGRGNDVEVVGSVGLTWSF